MVTSVTSKKQFMYLLPNGTSSPIIFELTLVLVPMTKCTGTKTDFKTLVIPEG